MKQLRNPWIIIPLILLGSFLHLLAAHNLRHWSELPALVPDASLEACKYTVGWIFFRSPWAAKITELTSSHSNAAGDKTQSKVTIEETPAPAQKETV